MNPYFTRIMAPHIAAFSLVTLPVMARTPQGPSIRSEVSRSFMAPESGQSETAVLHRRYAGYLIAPIPLGILSGMFVLTGDIIRNERVYQTAKAASAVPPQADVYAPAPADQPLGGFGVTYIPHHQEGAPLFETNVRRWNRVAQPEMVPPLWEATFGSTIDSKDLPFSITPSARDEGDLTAKVTYQRFGKTNRWIPQIGYRLRRPSGWEVDLLAPFHVLIARQKTSQSWRLYAGARWSPRVDPFVIPAAQSAERFSGWTMGWTTTALTGVKFPISPPLFLALEGGIQREIYQAFTEEGEELKSLKTQWGPWGQVALETWIRTP